MTRISFLSNSLGKKHSNGRYHPESPQRLEVIENWIHSGNHSSMTLEYVDEKASVDEILSVHSVEHHSLVEKTKNYEGHFHFDADTAANKYSYDAAMQAVHIGKRAIMESTVKNSIFCLTRPPGHHATRYSPQGFCLFNNIAIGTQLALLDKKYQRIAIIDFDHHFGNGTAYIHEKNPNILYISTHASPTIAYPGSGFIDEIGKEEGEGFNILVPLGYRATEADVSIVFNTIIDPILDQFKPEFVAISAGFDAYERDPVGVLGVSQDGFTIIGNHISKILSKFGIPAANYLEGGYNIGKQPELIKNYISPIIQGYDEELEGKSTLPIKPETEQTIQRAKQIFSDYWQL
ncbi:MAG: histone deacetylase family protein [Candidatus Hodarchaeales archaeon]|jgi:acetoin utilization deacetylase AcuC-like enzyme